MSKKQESKAQEPASKTYGLAADDYQLLYELNITANNVRRHLATFLTMLARDRYGYRRTDHLMFEVDWSKKQVIVSEREDADTKAEEGGGEATGK